jgi:ferredoxin-type protein NapF
MLIKAPPCIRCVYVPSRVPGRRRGTGFHQSTPRMQPERIRINRRQLLRGDLSSARAPARPPWALAEAAFIERCTRCADCVEACPEHVLRHGSGGYPEIDFSARGCTFCGACARACTRGALDARNLSSAAAWSLRAAVREGCLSFRGIVCRSCGEACEPRAIHFRLAPGGRAPAWIQAGACTGCGACVSVCPVGAILLKPGDRAEDSV